MNQPSDQVDDTLDHSLADSLFQPRHADEPVGDSTREPTDDEARTDEARTDGDQTAVIDRTVPVDHDELDDDTYDDTDDVLETPRRSRVTMVLLLVLLLLLGVLLGALLTRAIAPTPTPTTVYVLSTPASPSGR